MSGDSKLGHVKFYGNPICPFAHRAWWAAKEKNVPIEYVLIPLGAEKPDWFTKEVNPRGTVPVIKIGDKLVFESNIISEFFEDAFAHEGTRLLPEDPFARAAIRLLVDQWSQVVPALYALLKNQERSKDEELKQAIVTKLQGTVALLKAQSDGPFFLGKEVSLADIVVVPFIDRFAATLVHYRGFNVLEVDERIKQLYEASKERPAFQETSQPAEFYINGYKSYAHPSS